MKNILDLSLKELEEWFVSENEKSFRAKQILGWIYKGVYEFDNMTNISKNLVELLKNNFTIQLPKVERLLSSKVDGTKKFLLRLHDNNIIECVVMTYSFGNTICISTQVGCAMGCSFCASTLDGLVRHLTCGELLSQIIVAQNALNIRISNIVLMGSGEPLHNYDNVMKFIREVNAPYGLNIGARHITLSTCGLVPEIKELADFNLQINLAISLHASDNEKRKQIMKIANKYSIDELIESCRYYINKTNRRITFEYSIINNVNDSTEEAKRLGELLQGLLCHVNIIPVNSITERDYVKPSQKRIDEFIKVLSKYNINATTRREMGSDINAACGQLRKDYLDK